MFAEIFNEKQDISAEGRGFDGRRAFASVILCGDYPTIREVGCILIYDKHIDENANQIGLT